MRILWITNDIFEIFSPFVKGKPTKGGSWIAPLFYSIFNQENVKLGSITPVIAGEAQKQEIDQVIYYSIPIKKNGNKAVMSKKVAQEYLSATNDFQPDIIHIHGTERNFGLLRKYIDATIPIVCSIQGMIPPCLEYFKYSVANINFKKYRSIKNRVGRGGIQNALRKWGEYSVIEKEIFKLNQYFIGRTAWDKAYVFAFNPAASYYHGEELLRAPFYETTWDIQACERHRVFISSSAEPLKGLHILLKAAGILKRKYPDIKIVAPLSSLRQHSSKFIDFLISEDYNNYLKEEVNRLGLQNNILLLKKLGAKEMADEFRKAHVFALPSFIENSPNALGEAMMIGTPSVVAPVGGVLSIVKDEKSTLFFPAGDYVMLACQIDRLFSDDILAKKISENGRVIAQKRHNITDSTQQYMDVYADIIKKHAANSIKA